MPNLDITIPTSLKAELDAEVTRTKGTPSSVVTSAERIFSFGSFHLLPSRRLLLDGDTPIRVGSRALEILIALVERPGELISKEELFARVWPTTRVVEGNLKFQVAALRRALGDGRDGRRFLETSPGQGYRFVAAVTVSNSAALADSQPTIVAYPHNLPSCITQLIGRSDLVAKLVDKMADKRRLLTLVGPAGIGKTSVAIAVAERLIGTYADGVWLIDLAPVADPHLVPTALASVMGLETRSDSPLPTLISALRDMQTLLVFDNCEHVIEPAAALAALALKGSPGVRIIATSREPLRAEGEWVHRLGALESPPVSPRITATEALRFAAVQLFAERAAATTNDFELSDTNAPSACEICHKLDGIPLAIELAAGRVDMFGVRGLAARLDGRSRLLAFGRRGPLSRHRTLGAALDWSHQLLNQEEQTILRRLAIFAGGFTLASASAVAAGTDQNLSDITDTVESLVMKSLVEANVGEREVRFRLLETTRVFALAKLAESGEADELAHRHAAYFRDLLHARSSSPEGSDSISATAPEIDKFVPHSRGLLRRGAIDRLPLH